MHTKSEIAIEIARLQARIANCTARVEGIRSGAIQVRGTWTNAQNCINANESCIRVDRERIAAQLALVVALPTPAPAAAHTDAEEELCWQTLLKMQTHHGINAVRASAEAFDTLFGQGAFDVAAATTFLPQAD